MKTFITITAFILVGVLTALFFGFNQTANSIDYDDEQEGISEQVIIRFSHVAAENTPKGLAARYFAESVQMKTNDEVTVEIYSNGEIYQDQNEWEALTSGKVEMIAPATAKLSPLFPDWQVLDLPYAFQTEQAVQEAYEGKIGEELLNDLKRSNAKGLGFWYNGFKQFTNDQHPIIQPVDMDQLHFRTMPGPTIAAQFDAVNASTSELSFNKTYRNLEVDFIDGQENTVSNIYSKKFYKEQSFMTISNHAYLGYAILMNKSFWNKLSKSHQEAIVSSMEETTDWVRRHSIEINDSQIRELKRTSDIQIDVLTNAQRKKWKEAFLPVYIQAEKSISPSLLREVKRIQNHYSSHN
ncbi:DctP family TRAP transporter solute-binding subunit [Pseudalkalibacillus hwajinpoensis]|uniref:DctP family TRAP transporter solute-binding subunit n=1 Tax=Guptibacillus hwajinpoensis TaxID=208199 RepID=A0A4U1MP37_9BACL|nr:DctP family TRAP transporter solute-binding subunit [Pseudalkalibacillus hwajinpoensis]TKD72481.1 DctP family TRAP transporter solute-binding subunit [Pseudalkalibacillus hwajinpoensis]